jgi:hypothetical protein
MGFAHCHAKPHHSHPSPRRTALSVTSNQVLRRNFRADAVIHDFTPPDNPGNLFQELGDKVLELGAVAIGMDTRDGILAVLLGAAAWMAALKRTCSLSYFRRQQGKIVDSYPHVFEVFG